MGDHSTSTARNEGTLDINKLAAPVAELTWYNCKLAVKAAIRPATKSCSTEERRKLCDCAYSSATGEQRGSTSPGMERAFPWKLDVGREMDGWLMTSEDNSGTGIWLKVWPH